MKTLQYISLITLVLLAGAMVGIVAGLATSESIMAADKVYVSSATYDPEVFFSGDTGTLTIAVTNGNTDMGVAVNHAQISGDTIKSTSQPYDTSSNLGPGQTKSFPFSIAANGLDGIYYPTFSLSFRDADSLYYRAKVKIDNTPIIVTILDRPDTFSQGQKKTIYAQVANPRGNKVKNVKLNISGTGITATPSEVFIGDIDSGAKIPENFSVTADQPTVLHLALDYDNGDNHHSVTKDLPIPFGVDKKQANPVISNVQVKSDSGIYHITGDVNNAGLETANTVMVTSVSPAVPQDPYKTYVVGALKPDDFGSFEVTFSANGTSSVPIQLSYKDTDGNQYNSVQDVKISAATMNSENSGVSNILFPITAVVIVVGACIGGWYFYVRRNKK